MRQIVCSAVIFSLGLAVLAAAAEPGNPANATGVEFFEKQIRPLLAEHCYQCHGPKKQESGLALNTTAGLRKGGDRGVPIAPGEPDASLLIQAIGYADDDLKMPPRGKLKDEQIATLVEWIKRGAPAPEDEATSEVAVRPSSDFNLAERQKHWAYQPVQPTTPPLAGTKLGPADCSSPIDSFIVSKLAAVGLSPAPPADARTLIRRVSFDLTGLPPTPHEVAVFLDDKRPDAYERLVDRLLASPRYGERFGRHWLDVVRYSETLGFEFDYDLHNAWRYRDYVIRALNDDLPFDQFVIEHLAGDLLPEPRRHPIAGWNESILATGFWWMHEGKQTPVDIRQDQADRIDNQLDVLGKAFLGQTIACARCHDHKFDAISTRDYYALAGYLKSSRYQQAFIDPPGWLRPSIAALVKERKAIGADLARRAGEIWLQQSGEMSRYLLAAGGAGDLPLDPPRLEQWKKVLADESLKSPDHPLHIWSLVTRREPQQEVQTQRLAASAWPFANFQGSHFDRWFVTGDAFGNQPVNAGELVMGSGPARPIARLTTGGADSGLLSLRLQGELRSPSFTIDKKFVHLRLAGRDARVNLVIDGYTLIMNPMYGKLTVSPASDRLAWRTMPVDRWLGHRAFFEASDSTIPMHGLNPPPSAARVPAGADGYVAFDQIVLSDDADPPATPSGLNRAVIETAGGGELVAVADAYQRLTIEAIDRWRFAQAEKTALSDDDIALINWLLENGLLDASAAPSSAATSNDEALAAMVQRYQALEAAVPAPTRAPAFADGTGEDEFVYLRGNYKTLGEPAPRGLPEVLAGADAGQSGEGSGRLQLARRMVAAANPLLPRAIVNRLWQHHFGEGIIRTPDDFGRMGQPPTHPELLDHLASELLRGDWSLKNIQRRMVTSNTYRQVSGEGFRVQGSVTPILNPEPRTLNPSLIDPENRLLHRMPIRRLEAEAIRDSMLAVAGRLDETMHGPSVLPFLTPHMEGRGKPQSGLLDGAGRRSVYLNARRNFLTPLLLAFDYPVTFTPIGRRGTATIPAQALTLMNDPFVVQEATRWAELTLAEGGSTAEGRIESLYQSAFSRPPTADEIVAAIDFLQEQSLRHGSGSDDPRVWSDLCHVLLNVKEFLYVP